MASKGNQAFSALQVQVLNELGIDLWITRPDESAQNSLAAASPKPENSPAFVSAPVSAPIGVSPNVDPPVEQVEKVAYVERIEQVEQVLHSDAVADPVEYDLTCMRNSQLLVVAQTSGEPDDALLGSLLQVSVPGNRGQKFAFNWPQPNSSPGLDAARRAFLAFTSVQASKIESQVLVIFGRDISVLLSDSLSISKAEAEPALSCFDWNGFKCILIPEVDSLRVHWQLKRELCVHLMTLVPTLFSLSDGSDQTVKP